MHMLCKCIHISWESVMDLDGVRYSLHRPAEICTLHNYTAANLAR